MTAKCPCQQCGVNIEFDVEQANQFVACPSCGNQTRLLLPSSKPAIKEKESNRPQHLTMLDLATRLKDLLPKTAGNSETKKHLEFIRETSCYPELRFIINVCFLLLLIAVGCFVIFSAGTAIKYNQLFSFVLFLGGGALAVALLIAIRQSSLLIIDIADTLLHEHAKTKDTTGGK